MSVLEFPTVRSNEVSQSGVDPRGLRFTAAVTAVVLAVVVLTLPSPLAVALLVVQAVAFGAGAVLGVRAQPYGLLYRHLVRPWLVAPAHVEDPAPPRFAQSIGLGFTLVALTGLAVGSAPTAYAAVGLALAAAVLNAAFDFCLGCELYLRVARLRRRGAAATPRTETAAERPHITEGETA